jgi:putative transposase
MKEYRHGAHSVFEIHLHLVWTTKYRKPVLVGMDFPTDGGRRVKDLSRSLVLGW